MFSPKLNFIFPNEKDAEKVLKQTNRGKGEVKTEQEAEERGKK